MIKSTVSLTVRYIFLKGYSMKKLLSIICIVLIVASSLAEAANRKGSHRVGGYNSHGKGSHYVGGHR